MFPSAAVEEMKHTISAEVSANILDIFAKKLEEKLIRHGIGAVRDRLENLTKKELAYHLSQHTEVELLANNEWKIAFEFEVINAGFIPISTRLHNYWFEYPQGQVDFAIYGEDGMPIEYSVVKSSEKYRQICLKLPTVLNALDRFKYKISYQVKSIVEQDSFYYLCPKTLTKKLSLYR